MTPRSTKIEDQYELNQVAWKGAVIPHTTTTWRDHLWLLIFIFVIIFITVFMTSFNRAVYLETYPEMGVNIQAERAFCLDWNTRTTNEWRWSDEKLACVIVEKKAAK